MSDDGLENSNPLERILGRDGFSPDLPATLDRHAQRERISLPLRLMLYMLSGLRVGSLEVRLPGGSVRRLQGAEPGPHAVWQIHNDGLVRHVLRAGEVGIGEAYMDGCWDTPDLTSLLEVLYLNEPYYRGPFEKNWLGRVYGWWQHKRRANTRRRARANIEHHYDLGNDFYRLWLDPTMAYSSAVYETPGQDLQAAQLNKFRHMFERLDLRPEHTLLEIGSGWGGFAIYAAQHSGCRVHSITLSSEQLAEARRRAAVAGVADRVSFEICDYRDVAGRYDRVVSIEMYEAVGEEFWKGYFEAIHRALRPGGRAAIQGITINPAIFDNYRSKRDFVQKYIFPGGMLCPPELFQQVARDAGLQPVQPKFFALDYAETLAQWHRNLLDQRDAVLRLFDQRFLQMWRYYLSYCECGFRTGSIDLMQITLERA